MANAIYLSLFVFLSAFINNFISATPTKNGIQINGNTSHDASDLEYWSEVVKDEQTLYKVMQNAREYADAIRHYEWTYASEHYGKPDFKPIAPMTLFPSKFPRKLFDLAHEVQPAMNLLYFRASRDFEFLAKSFAEMAKSDEYVGNLLNILQEMRHHGYRQPIAVQLQRAIEVNVGGGGGPPMGRRMTKVHRKTLTQLGLDASMEVLRDNQPYNTYAQTLYQGWLKFGDPEAIMIITWGVLKKGQKGGKKTQWDLEEELERLSDGKLKHQRMTMEECDEKLYLHPEDFSLRVKKDDKKVAIVFYRFLIGTDPREWHARSFIERSTALKAPTIGMELLGTKKGQQILAMPGAVERFFPDREESHYVDAIRKTFTGLWGLDQSAAETNSVVQDALANPDRYVLKPMKEGGGHNFFGQDLVDKLNTFSLKERSAHILMQRLQPMAVPNYIVRPCEEPKFGMVVSELGMFGGLVGNIENGKVLHNHAHGYLVRSKGRDSNEGGVLAGLGAYDSPYLY